MLTLGISSVVVAVSAYYVFYYPGELEDADGDEDEDVGGTTGPLYKYEVKYVEQETEVLNITSHTNETEFSNITQNIDVENIT